MKSITIHGLDSTLEQLIKKKAQEAGTSLNQTIKKLLRESLGIDTNNTGQRRGEFLEFFGVWSKNEEKEFNKRNKSFEKIDKED